MIKFQLITIAIVLLAKPNLCPVESWSIATINSDKQHGSLSQAESAPIVIPAAAGAAAVGALSTGHGAQNSAGAISHSRGASGASGIRSSSGGGSGFARANSASLKAHKRGGRKQGYASAAGHASHYGKRGGRFISYGSGHRRMYGTVKTFKHSKGFKYGFGGSYGAMGGYKKGFKARKGYLRAAAGAGAKKHSRGATKTFTSARSAGMASRQAVDASSSLKSGALSQTTVSGAHQGGVIKGVAG